MSTITVDVPILGKEYQISCPESERAALLKAAAELDRRMRDIRQSGNVLGLERISVIAALNLCYELLQKESSQHEEQLLLQEMHQQLDDYLG